MFHCERCGIRFSAGVLSGRMDCPRCSSRDGVTVMLTWEPMLAARAEAVRAQSRAESRRASARVPVGPAP